MSLLLPALLCTSHKEELADLNERLSTQEEEICQKAQVVRSLQVAAYTCTSYLLMYVCTYILQSSQHLTVMRPLKPTLTVST